MTTTLTHSEDRKQGIGHFAAAIICMLIGVGYYLSSCSGLDYSRFHKRADNPLSHHEPEGIRANFVLPAAIVDSPPVSGVRNTGTKYEPAVTIAWSRVSIAFDSLNKFFIPQFGKSMSVDQADSYKEFYYRQINSIFINSRGDSLEIKTK